MDELKFVLKCFLFSCLLMSLTQLKTDGITIEARVQNYLVSSSVADFVNKTAEGGVKFINNFTATAKEYFEKWFSSAKKTSDQYFNKSASVRTSTLYPQNPQLSQKKISSDEADFDNQE